MPYYAQIRSNLWLFIRNQETDRFGFIYTMSGKMFHYIFASDFDKC